MLRVHPVPAFDDNYLWLLEDGTHAAVVDPGDEEPVEAFLASRGLVLRAILVTHHHGDHTGGIEALAGHWHCEVFGAAADAGRIPGLTRQVQDGDVIELPGLGESLAVLAVPGHTRAHIAYLAGRGNHLFCGDTLFACGCGRLFEGTPAQMLESLQRLAALPGDTRVYCAHEYTLANIRFARAVEPANAALAERQARDGARRDRGEPTLPSTLAEERATNPFLRWDAPDVRAAAARQAGRPLASPVEVFAQLRQWKNDFR